MARKKHTAELRERPFGLGTIKNMNQGKAAGFAGERL